MIDVTDEMAEAGWNALPVSAQESGEVDLDDMKLVLAAGLAIVERDHVMRPRRVAIVRDPHAHVCASCSPDGSRPGAGCGNCRQTGFDQTPCLEPGHLPRCPAGCCEGGAS